MQKNENLTKEKKLLSPKLDVVFQALFGEVGNEEITKDFLEKILKRKIEEIDLSKNVILRRTMPEEKLGVLDVLVETNNKKKINIEMQVVEKSDMIERILYYWARLYCSGIKEGEEYKKLEDTIVILIADYEIKQLNELKCHTEWKIKELIENVILTDKLDIHIIELPKIKGLDKTEKDKLMEWLIFLNNPNDERLEKIMVENKAIKEAVEKLELMSNDREIRRIAELREKAVRDEKATYSKGVEDGTEQGIKKGIEQGIKKGIEQGIKQGKEQGRIEGIEIGIEQGKEEGRNEGKEIEKKQIAKNLLNIGLSVEQIAKSTGLTTEEIEKLINNCQ